MKWFIVSYDIRDPKRLKQTHYYLKKEAVALQKSVFLVNATHIQQVKTIIHQHTNSAEDDVRLYPITHPNAIWAAGCQANALASLGITPQQPHQQPSENFVKKLLRGFLTREKERL